MNKCATLHLSVCVCGSWWLLLHCGISRMTQGSNSREMCVQNKPTLSVSPSSCAIKTQGHSHTLARLFKQLCCNNFFFLLNIKWPLKVLKTRSIMWAPRVLIHPCKLHQPRTVFANAVQQHEWIPQTERKQLSLTTNLEGRLKFEQDWLAEEDLPGFEAETTDFVLCQLNILPRSGAFHCEGERESETEGEKKGPRQWEKSHWTN